MYLHVVHYKQTNILLDREKHDNLQLRQSKLVKLKKFAFQEDAESWQDKLINFVCSLLCTAHNYTLLQSDIRRKAKEQEFMEYSCKRKWAWLGNAVRELPYIELIRVKSVPDNSNTTEDEDNEGCHLAWKLDPKLMPSSAKAAHVLYENPTVKEEVQDGTDDVLSSSSSVRLNFEESIEQQIYRMVSENPDGIRQVELREVLGIGYKLYNRIVEELEKAKRIVRVAEGVNKTMCYRLFTQENYAKAYNSDSAVGIAVVKSGETQRQQLGDGGSNVTTETEQSEEPPPAKRACRSNQNSENDSNTQGSAENGGGSSSGPRVALTTRTLNRMVNLEKLVAERKIVTLFEASLLLYAMENPAEPSTESTGMRKKTLDRKALRRVGSLLAESGSIKTAALTMRLHTGSIVSVEVFYAKEIENNGPELKEFSQRYVEEQEADSRRKSSLNFATKKIKREELENLPIQHVDNLTRIFGNDATSLTVSPANRKQRLMSGTMLRTKSLFPRIKVLHMHLCKEVFGEDSMGNGNEHGGPEGSLAISSSNDSLTAISRVIGPSVVSSIKDVGTGNETVTSEGAGTSSEETAKKPFSINNVILAMTIKNFKYVCIDTGLDSIPEEYDQDLLLKELPDAVQARILRSNSMKKVNRFLSVLARMELIQPVNIATFSLNDATHMLAESGSFLDSTSMPSAVKKYRFADTASVKAYWDDLEYASRYVIAQKDSINEAKEGIQSSSSTEAAEEAAAAATTNNNNNENETKRIKRKGKRYLRTLEGPAVIPIEGVEELMNETNWSHHTEKIDAKKRAVLYQHIPSQGQLYLSLTEAKYVARQVRIPTADLFFYQGYLIRRRLRPVENAQKERVPRHVTAFINRKRKLETAEPEQPPASADILYPPAHQPADLADDVSATSAGMLADFEIFKPMRAKFSEKDDKRILKEVVSYCRRNNGGKFTTSWPPHTFDALSYELRKDPVKLEWHISRLLRRTATRNIIEAALAIGNGEAAALATKPAQELPSTMAEFAERFVAEHKASPFSRISKDKKPSLTSAATSLSSDSSSASRAISISPVLSTLCMIAATPKRDYSPSDGYLALSKYTKGLIEEAQGLLIEVGAIKKKPAEVDDERNVACTEAFADSARSLGYNRNVFDSAEQYKQCAVNSEESLTIERGTDPGIVWESLMFAENGTGALTPLLSPSPSAKAVSSVVGAPIPRCGVLRHIISMQNPSSANVAADGIAPTHNSSDMLSWTKGNYKSYLNNIHSHEKFCVEFGLNQVPSSFVDNERNINERDINIPTSTSSSDDDDAMDVEVTSCDDALAVLRKLGMYNDAELLHCQHMIDSLRTAGVAGLRADSFRECGCTEVGTAVCLQALSNLGVVVRVPDVLEIKYVLHEFASHWLLRRIPSEKAGVPLAGVSPDCCKWASLQPWMLSDGTLNGKMVEAAQNRIVCLVTKNPGIEERKLCSMLPFTQGATLELLEALEAENRVRKTTVLTRCKPTLFGPGKATSVVCYHPVLPYMFDSYLPFNEAQDDVLSSPVQQESSPTMDFTVPMHDDGDVGVAVSTNGIASVVVTTENSKIFGSNANNDEMEEDEDEDDDDDEEEEEEEEEI